MKNYFVTPQREGNRSKHNSYVDLGFDKHGNPINIPCPHQFTFLEIKRENNKPKLVSSECMRGWIIMLSGQISCPPDISDRIEVIAKGEKEIIGAKTQVLLLSTELEDFFLRVKRQKGFPAYILKFYRDPTTILYGEESLKHLKLHGSTEYCNGGLIKL
jgi:hypothetical protein